MSAIIWGVINLNNNIASKKLGLSMMDYMNEYKIDKFKYIVDNNVFIGCGLQYITPESINEVLPYYDQEQDLYFTCDAIIDNRKELLKAFNLTNNKESDFTDSEYILMAYKKWGKECAKHLLGDYTFLIYDKKNNEVICSKDQLGRRTLYYYYDKNRFAFCTITKPLLKITCKSTKLNERWIADFLALYGCLHVTEEEECIYEDIKQIPAANTLIVSSKGIEKIHYWNPYKNLREYKFNSDEECVSEFLKVYEEAVKCRLRSRADVAISLSGGLDSSSVAAIAAPLLKADGKVLKSFTSVPINEYKKSKDIHSIEDETESVKLISSYVGNIETHFCPMKGKNAYNSIDELVDIFEQPYKLFANSHFINNVGKEVSDNNCKVLLKGQYGNVTISTGDFYSYAISLIQEKRFITLGKQINEACKMHKLPKIKFTKSILQFCIPEKTRLKRFYKSNPNYDRFKTSCINSKLLKKWNIPERFDEYGFNKPIDKLEGFKTLKECMVSPVVNSHVTAVTTKIGLRNGIILRDPTADVRVIEFCLRVPMEQYVQGGVDRRLIRNAMKGLLPDEIRMNISKRGVQAPDWIKRLEPVWNEVYHDIEVMINDRRVENYFNIEKLSDIARVSKNLAESKESDVKILFEALVFYKFITKFLFSYNNFIEGGDINGKEDMDGTKG